jgi:hypothetical protein
MSSRKYSVQEIDRMRVAIPKLAQRYEALDGVTKEERLRTYMLNGTDPEELEREAEAAMRQRRLKKSGDDLIRALRA